MEKGKVEEKGETPTAVPDSRAGEFKGFRRGLCQERWK